MALALPLVLSTPFIWIVDDEDGARGTATPEWPSTDVFRDRKGVPMGDRIEESFDKAEGTNPGMLGEPSCRGLSASCAGLIKLDLFLFVMRNGMEGCFITGVIFVGVPGKEITPGFGAPGSSEAAKGVRGWRGIGLVADVEVSIKGTEGRTGGVKPFIVLLNWGS